MTTKKPAKKAVSTKPKTRQLKTKPYRSFRLTKRIKHSKPKLTTAWRLFLLSLKFLRQNWKLFLSIVVVYFILTAVMVKGLGVSVGVKEAKSQLQDKVFTGTTGTLLTSVTLFGVLLGSTSSASSDVASVYQSILLVMTSLAVIWGLRQTYAGKKTSMRESFYKGMYPMVPFLLVLLVIGLQLLPIAAGTMIYSVVIVGGIAVTVVEKVAWILLIILLALLSLYMVSSSIFALYISTLPNMTPLGALRSARELVRYRRWMVMRKVLFLPVMLLVVGAVIMVPIIIVVTVAAEWVYFGLSMITLAVVHSYLYSLYRELL